MTGACRHLAGHPYSGSRAAIATMHGKEVAIGPVLARWFGISLDVARVDTDALGTFTGDVPRAGTMLDAARAKALLAIEACGAPLGIGSEGAFGPHPHLPFVASGHELVLLREAATGHEITAHRRTATNFDHMIVQPGVAIDQFLERIGFPSHAVIVQSDANGRAPTAKGLQERKSVDVALSRAFDRSIPTVLGTDMRAHLNPTRMTAISRTARALAIRIARLCPSCSKPGFGLVNLERGLPCRDCLAPTRIVEAELYGCSACYFQVRRHVRCSASRADPTWCELCNP